MLFTIVRRVKRLLAARKPVAALTVAAPEPNSRLQASQDAFDNIYRQDLWALRSGEYAVERPGLETEHARNARLGALIQDLLRLNNITSVVEFGCGYFGYASQVDWTGIEYDGYDIAEDVINSNRQLHAKPNIRFHLVRNGTRMPRAELLISKDVLQHLPTEDIHYYLSKFKSNFRYMLIGNDCFPADNLNGDTVHGGYRALRLELPPFNFPNTILQQWRCVEFGTFIIKNFCLFQGATAQDGIEGITLDDERHTQSGVIARARDVVGFADFSYGGWGNSDTGEIFQGFSIKENDEFVDVGCGDGPFSAFAAEQGASLTLLDVDPAKIALALQRVSGLRARRVRSFTTDCNPIPLPDEVATKIICTEVLEHVSNPTALVAEMVRIAAPGAQFLFSVPHPFSENLQELLAPREYFQPPFHVRVFSRASFENLIMSSGLTLERWHADGFYWTLYTAMVWSCEADDRPHPTLDAWAECWLSLLGTKDGVRIKAALDAAAPSRQLILARKPVR